MSFPRLFFRPRLVLAFTVALSASCGPKNVQLYEGAQLPNEQVTFLYSNKHLDITVDRSYTVPLAEKSTLHRLALPEGHHAAEVRCLYTGDVTYHPTVSRKSETPSPDGGPAPPAAPALPAEKLTASPVIALAVEGQAGHSYKPRVHFSRNETGLPGCRVKVFDVTDEPGGEKVDFY